MTAFVPPAAILDIDGTLVDTNYQHAIAWYRAFRQQGVVLPIWKIHRHIGMGGDQLIASHPDVPVDAPDRQHHPVLAECAGPRQRVLVVRVDERPVDVQDGCRLGH